VDPANRNESAVRRTGWTGWTGVIADSLRGRIQLQTIGLLVIDSSPLTEN
jgi:hypothetical protein